MRQPWFDTAAPALWPPDDTEESVVGSEYHQHVIDASRDGLRMAARANGAAWHVLSQVPLAGFRRPDGSAYTMLPDVFVHPRPNPHPRLGVTLTIAEIGVPLLAVEVLSETTYQQDVDERHGKAWSYADAGVAEYLIVDYDRRYIEEHVRALRLVDGRWTRWQADANGRWVSAALGVSFEFDAPYLRVRDAAARLKPLPDEADALLLEQAALLMERTSLLTEQSAQLTERDALLERIRALVDAGDLEAVRALLADTPLGEHPG
jgi:hypothetical protein